MRVLSGRWGTSAAASPNGGAGSTAQVTSLSALKGYDVNDIDQVLGHLEDEDDPSGRESDAGVAPQQGLAPKIQDNLALAARPTTASTAPLAAPDSATPTPLVAMLQRDKAKLEAAIPQQRSPDEEQGNSGEAGGFWDLFNAIGTYFGGDSRSAAPGDNADCGGREHQGALDGAQRAAAARARVGSMSERAASSCVTTIEEDSYAHAAATEAGALRPAARSPGPAGGDEGPETHSAPPHRRRSREFMAGLSAGLSASFTHGRLRRGSKNTSSAQSTGVSSERPTSVLGGAGLVAASTCTGRTEQTS